MMPVRIWRWIFLDFSNRSNVWDLYDIFLQFINSPDNLHAGVDAVTGPTPAYASVDRGFGRTGYPAISMSASSCKGVLPVGYLSRTERTYTIPNACSVGDLQMSVMAGLGISGTAQKTTHPVATKEPNSLGVYDLRGNVGEWVITENGLRVVGGSFRTPAEDLGSASILEAEKELES